MNPAKVADVPHKTAAPSTIQRPFTNEDGGEPVGVAMPSEELAATQVVTLFDTAMADSQVDFGPPRAFEKPAHLRPAQVSKPLATHGGDLIAAHDTRLSGRRSFDDGHDTHSSSITLELDPDVRVLSGVRITKVVNRIEPEDTMRIVDRHMKPLK